MGLQLANNSSSDYFSTPQRRKGESLGDYADRLAVYDANYSAPRLIEKAVPKIKPRYRVKAWRAISNFNRIGSVKRT